MKSIPTVQKYMTYIPKSIGHDRPLKLAMDEMREHNIRHLPVLKGGKLVGILTDRDIKLVLGFQDADPNEILVDEAYTPNPYQTTPQTPLDQVTAEMAEHKYGCALVVDNHKLVGIFTETDALTALSELLHTRLKT